MVGDDSDLFVAQPITFATMRAARELAGASVAATVNLFAVQLGEEEEVGLPECFVRLPGLDRSVADLKEFKSRRNLPLIRDILQVLYESDCTDYMIYTNADIALQPYFYWTVAGIIAQGHDAFAINRRSISDRFRDFADIPLMYSELGEGHQGWDCFVFKRDLYPRFNLGQACIGAGWIGRVLLTNMACLAKNFRIFTDLHMTFHVGNQQVWKTDLFSDYTEHNKEECRNILHNFEAQFGLLDRQKIPGRFLDRLEPQAGQ
jgi:hypothetical protein